jgi:broad specificity phosphatase PhoE
MSKVVVVRPGSTSFDEQDRMKGCLDIPLSTAGLEQVRRMASEIAHLPITVVYCGPCESAQATAREIADATGCRWKVYECFQNLDHGLWQGKCIEEIKRQQPKLYKQVQDNPRAFSPPGGETIDAAESRIAKQLAKLQKKHANETIAVVIPEPMATLVASKLKSVDFEDLWKSECDKGSWEIIGDGQNAPSRTGDALEPVGGTRSRG